MTCEPLHEHDCDVCVFLGSWEAYDLYYCPQSGMPTVIARYGTLGSYISGLHATRDIPALAVAQERARVKGLLP